MTSRNYVFCLPLTSIESDWHLDPWNVDNSRAADEDDCCMILLLSAHIVIVLPPSYSSFIVQPEQLHLGSCKGTLMVARTFIVYFATNHNIAVIILTQHACVSFSPFCPLTFFRDTTLVTVVTLQVTLVTFIDSVWGNDSLCAVHKEDGTLGNELIANQNDLFSPKLYNGAHICYCSGDSGHLPGLADNGAKTNSWFLMN